MVSLYSHSQLIVELGLEPYSPDSQSGAPAFLPHSCFSPKMLIKQLFAYGPVR